MDARSGGRLGRVSRLAVDRAAALTGRVDPAAVDVAALAALLYRAGGCAVDDRLDPRWPRHLTRQAERPVAAALSDHARGRSEHWDSWSAPGVDATELVHKVYVSPTVKSLRRTLEAVFTCVLDHEVPAWKVGADLAGIHRPDKVVLYLPTAEAADAVAGLLDHTLVGQDAQGVPFSGQVGESGIVSRGRDLAGTSWRAVVCRLVAQALWTARSDVAGSAHADAQDQRVAQLALDLVAAQGFDTVTWRPERCLVGVLP